MSSLFDLINSLSKSEKRFFRLWSSRYKGEKNYLKLFGYVDKMKVWDEKRLRDTITEKELLKNLSYEKNNLYRQVTRFLAQHNPRASVDSRLQDIFRTAEVLFEKSLYAQCGGLVDKAAALAGKYEKFTALIDVLKWRKRLLTDRSDYHNSEDVARSHAQKADQYVRMMELNLRCTYIHDRIFAYVNRHGKTRPKDTRPDIIHLIEKEVPEIMQSALPFDAKRFALNALYAYCRFAGEDEKSHDYAVQHVEHLERFPHLVREVPSTYLAALNNLLIIQVETSRYREFETTLKKLEQVDGSFVTEVTESYEILQFQYLCNVKLSGFITMGKFSEGVAMAGYIENGISRFEAKIGHIFLFLMYYNVAVLHFGMQEYRKALQWINRAFIVSEKSPMGEYFVFAKLFSILIHYELGNMDLLEYMIRSAYRHLLKRDRLYQMETLFLTTVRQSQTVNNEKELKSLFVEWKQELEFLQKDPFEREGVDYYFDFISWLESKITGKSFADVVRGKAKAKAR